MAYDEALAERVRLALAGHRPAERKMFGGLAFMVGGHMVVGVLGADLVVRVGKAAEAAALARPHVRPMDFTGRPLGGFVYVGAAGVRKDADLKRWVDEAVAHAKTLKKKS